MNNQHDETDDLDTFQPLELFVKELMAFYFETPKSRSTSGEEDRQVGEETHLQTAQTQNSVSGKGALKARPSKSEGA